MKRIIIGVIACICAITVMAQVQTHDVKGVVFDRKQQPIVGALVTAKGTNISTITDVDGKFFLQEVPLSVKKVIVTSIGMETREVDLNVPVQLTGKRKKLSFVAHAGISMSKSLHMVPILRWDMSLVWVLKCACQNDGLSSLLCKFVTVEQSSMPKETV